MGAKTWMLVYADGDARSALAAEPTLDRKQTLAFARSLFPGEVLTPLQDGDLRDACPPDNELCIGCFPGISVVAAMDFAIEQPSQLPARFTAPANSRTLTLHVMYSVSDWLAFAQWRNGKLIRSLSVSSDDGVLEGLGPKLPFEEPYWAGERPVADDEDQTDYPLPFHPLELGEAALSALFGYNLEGEVISNLIRPEWIPMMRFTRTKSRWKVWR